MMISLSWMKRTSNRSAWWHRISRSIWTMYMELMKRRERIKLGRERLKEVLGDECTCDHSKQAKAFFSSLFCSSSSCRYIYGTAREGCGKMGFANLCSWTHDRRLLLFVFSPIFQTTIAFLILRYRSFWRLGCQCSRYWTQFTHHYVNRHTIFPVQEMSRFWGPVKGQHIISRKSDFRTC